MAASALSRLLPTADADILVSTPLRLAALLRSAAPRRLDRVEILVVRSPQTDGPATGLAPFSTMLAVVVCCRLRGWGEVLIHR